MGGLHWDYIIRQSSHGGFNFARGLFHSGGEIAPSGIGYTLPAFVEYHSSHYDTLEQAKKAAKKEISQYENLKSDEIDLNEMVKMIVPSNKRRHGR